MARFKAVQVMEIMNEWEFDACCRESAQMYVDGVPPDSTTADEATFSITEVEQ